MKWFFSGIIVFCTIFAIFSGNISEFSASILESAENAVMLCLSLVGIISLWSGVMKIAENSGVTDSLGKLLSPILSLLFKGIDKSGKAMKAISMNVISNLFGLANASTPLGIEAMKCLEREEHSKYISTQNMITLVVINTASIQLVPTTVAALRLSNGSSSPFEIIPAVLISSFVSVTVAVISTRIFNKLFRRH